jgi:hypothetical protein
MKLPGLGFNAGTLALGAAALLLGPTIIAAARGLTRTVAKAGIKEGLILYEKGKETAAETKGSVEDLTVEARSEITGKSKRAKRTKK